MAICLIIFCVGRWVCCAKHCNAPGLCRCLQQERRQCVCRPQPEGERGGSIPASSRHIPCHPHAVRIDQNQESPAQKARPRGTGRRPQAQRRGFVPQSTVHRHFLLLHHFCPLHRPHHSWCRMQKTFIGLLALFLACSAGVQGRLLLQADQVGDVEGSGVRAWSVRAGPGPKDRDRGRSSWICPRSAHARPGCKWINKRYSKQQRSAVHLTRTRALLIHCRRHRCRPARPPPAVRPFPGWVGAQPRCRRRLKVARG